MANADRPSGLSPVSHLLGGGLKGNVNIYYIPTSDNTNAYAIGDPVASGGSADGNGIPSVTLATAGTGNAIRGVIVAAGTNPQGGPYINPNNLGTIVVPVAKAVPYYVAVADDPYEIFEVQEVSGGTALTAAEVGLNANLVAGANNGYLSGWELNNSGEGTGATLQVRILRLAPRLNNAYGEHAKWWVLINNHELKAGTAGV